MPYPRKNRKETKERSLKISKSSGSLSAYLADACIRTLLKDENVDSVLAISSVGSPNKIFDQYLPAIRNQLAEFAEMMVEWESTRGVMRLIERIKKYQKPVILAAPPTSREESEAIREIKKNGIVVHLTPERAIKILAYITKYAEDKKKKSDA